MTEVRREGGVLIVTRRLAAPPELVWRAFTERGRIEQWWGPDGFTTTTHEMDVRPGGRWRFIMHGPDGVDFPNLVVYEAVEPPARLVYRHGDDGADVPVSFQVTVTLSATESGTLVEMRSAFETESELLRVDAEYGAIEGARECLARLAEHVAEAVP